MQDGSLEQHSPATRIILVAERAKRATELAKREQRSGQVWSAFQEAHVSACLDKAPGSMVKADCIMRVHGLHVAEHAI